ncbi:hypothetical protein ScPMuIL_006938 [Solemya velum]
MWDYDPDLVIVASSVGSVNITPLPIKKFTYTSCEPSEVGTDLLPICRICQLPGDKEDSLFSPCRCSGSVRYIHQSCLKKWVEISTRKTKKPPKCEICHYTYHRRKRFKTHDWKWPRVNNRDKCLHCIFLMSLLIMMGCAIATVMCFLSDKEQIAKTEKNLDLTTEEIVTLSCGVMFFVAFFIAMTVEIKARHTMYKLFMKFVMHNTDWTVDPYERDRDSSYVGPPEFV